MLRYMAVRLLQTVPVLLGVSFLVFASIFLLPGDVTQQLLGLGVTEQAKIALRLELGLDKPFAVQFLTWLQRLAGGNLGASHVMRTPVLQVLLDKGLNSLLLMLASLAIVVCASLTLATTAAARVNSTYDRAVIGLCFLLASAPVFWLGMVLVLAFGIYWPVLPMAGMYDVASPGGMPDLLLHLVLPAFTTAATSVAIVARVTRSVMIEELSKPYVVAARARGLSAGFVVYRHALRNALPTFATMCGLQIGYLFGSAVFSEIIFAWPGIGLQLYSSIIARDGPMIQGCVLAVAAVFVLGNFVADSIVHYLDVYRTA